jgi:DNA-binding LacI/PurR family transcriptional regulator
MGDRFGYRTELHRLEGFHSAMAAAGVSIPAEYVVQADGLPSGGYAASHQLLALPDRPSAIFCYNDMSLLGALRAAADLGLSVPRDLSLVGFDDLFFAEYVQPPATTIHQPKKEMGRRAVELLFALLNDQSPEKSILIQGELIVRASSAPPLASTRT